MWGGSAGDAAANGDLKEETMPGRLKRSEKRARLPAVEPQIPPPILATGTALGAFCPVCGHTIPENRAIKIGHVTVDRVGYFGSIDWDPNKPFGASFAARGGRGPFREWHYISPEEAPELFKAVKGRLIDAVREWVEKGWINEEELIRKGGPL